MCLEKILEIKGASDSLWVSFSIFHRLVSLVPWAERIFRVGNFLSPTVCLRENQETGKGGNETRERRSRLIHNFPVRISARRVRTGDARLGRRIKICICESTSVFEYISFDLSM